MTETPRSADDDQADRGREYGRIAPDDTPTDENDADRADRGREYGRTDVDSTGSDPDITSDTGR